jgi:ATP-dependent protease ClpP protease subunit
MKIISIRGTIGWDVTPDDIRNQFKDAKGDIIVEIASPGGFVYDGLDIFNLIRDYKGGKVTTKLMGIAASMASVIALAGDKVIAHDNAVFMIHNASNIVWGNHLEMREMADHLEKVSNHLAKIYVRKTGKSISEIKELLDADGGSGTYLFGDEILKAGFVDEIIESDDSDTLDKDSSILTAMMEIENCTNKLKESENSKKDLQKAAASLTPMAQPKNNTDISPATPGIVNSKIKEENTMNELEKFLAANPGAKADYDKAIASAVKQGEEKVNARIEVAKNYIGNDKYPTLSVLAMKVINGEIDALALESAVAVIDATIAKTGSDAAIDETQKLGDTGAEGGKPVNDSGDCENDADLDQEIARTKKQNGDVK